MGSELTAPPLRPLKALLNGLIAWALGFVIYMLPGFAIGLQMGYELGSGGMEQGEISRQIGTQVAAFYHGNVALAIGAIMVIGLLVYWRAHRVSRDAGVTATKRGVLVGLVAAILGTLMSARYHVGIVEIAAILVYLGAGIAGARRGASRPAPASTPEG